MSNLALSRIRTGIAAAIAEDRMCSVRRKQELLLGPTPWEEALGLTPGMLDGGAADKAAQKDNTIVTSTGRRIKVWFLLCHFGLCVGFWYKCYCLGLAVRGLVG
jgi:hypothetical protein